MSRGFSGPVERVLSLLKNVRRSPSGATARCPSHDDTNNSLSIGEGEDRKVLLKCHKECRPEDIVKAIGLTVADLFEPKEEVKPRVVAEYEYRYADGELSYVAVRYEPKDFRQKRPNGYGGWIWNLEGIEPLPYHLPQLAETALSVPVLVVEGEKDVERVEKLGFTATTNSSGGTKWYPAHAKWLKGRQVVIIPDNDDKGRAHAEVVGATLLGISASTQVLELPGLRQKGDVSDWLNAGGTAEELREMMRRAPSYEEWLHRRRTTLPPEIVGAQRLSDEIAILYETGLTPGHSTGWSTLDPHYTVKLGQWTLLTGVPGHGKTNWLDHLLVHLATLDEDPWRFVVFSAEVSPDLHTVDLLEKIADKPFRRGPTARMTKLEAEQHFRSVVERSFRFIDADAYDDLTVDRILEITEQVARAEPIKGLVIDPWNEVVHTWAAERITETIYISTMLGKIRRFARRLNVHVWIVAHPKSPEKDKSGNYPVPTPYDVAGGAHWRNKADNAICVWRSITEDGDQPEVDIHVQKIRRREIGRIGKVTLLYDKVTGRYSDAPYRPSNEPAPHHAGRSRRRRSGDLFGG